MLLLLSFFLFQLFVFRPHLLKCRLSFFFSCLCPPPPLSHPLLSIFVLLFLLLLNYLSLQSCFLFLLSLVFPFSSLCVNPFTCSPVRVIALLLLRPPSLAPPPPSLCPCSPFPSPSVSFLAYSPLPLPAHVLPSPSMSPLAPPPFPLPGPCPHLLPSPAPLSYPSPLSVPRPCRRRPSSAHCLPPTKTHPGRVGVVWRWTPRFVPRSGRLIYHSDGAGERARNRRSRARMREKLMASFRPGGEWWQL